MTFSIVGRSLDGTELGVAVASKFLAVGWGVPAARAGVGALATQAFVNLAYRPQGLALLATGATAAATITGLTAADGEREIRQLGVVAATGDGATYTGGGCHDWAGGVAGDGYAIQGNILVGPAVVQQMERAWLAGDPTAPLAPRLLAALTAGDGAGGDARGRQSAALYVVTTDGSPISGGCDVLVDLRVDDHSDPVPELTRLLDLHEVYFGRPDPDALLALTGELAQEVRERLAALGHTGDDVEAALFAWAGVENYEARLVPGRIDPVVLAMLRAAGR